MVRKAVPVDCEGAAGGQFVRISRRHDQGVGAAHFLVKEANRVRFRIVGAKRIRAYELGEPLSLVSVGHMHRAHFVDCDRNASLGDLPSGLRASQPATNDVYFAHMSNRSAKAEKTCAFEVFEAVCYHYILFLTIIASHHLTPTRE